MWQNDNGDELLHVAMHLVTTQERAGMNQRIDHEELEPQEVRHLGNSPYTDTDLDRMNDRFAAAMAAAIRAGLERPPRVGIDRTPGTKNPSHVPYGASNLPGERILRVRKAKHRSPRSGD